MDLWQAGSRAQLVQDIQSTKDWDMVVIGGGITGAGVAREAARQGLKVLLVEQKDFAWGTSSRSSKMVHGGLRYLASGNFKLTSHSVKERERLMNEAPGLVDLMPYQWLHYKKQFPTPFVFNSLLTIYDTFAGQKYRHFLKKEETEYQLPAVKNDELIGSTRFADAVTDDSRLVIRVLKEAVNDGAVCLNYAKVTDVIKENDKVSGVGIQLETGESIDVKATVVVSATGAWADEFRVKLGASEKIRPLRGSHLVLHSWRLPVSQSITLKHPDDGRSMFIFPWEGMTVVGTTDLDNPKLNGKEPFIHDEEVEYLLSAANKLFPSAQLERDDIVSTFAGVRPIVSGGALNPSSEKRDHSIWDDQGLVTVSGGKLTTFRLIALDVLKAAKAYIPSLDYKDHNQYIFSETQGTPEKLKELEPEWQRRLKGFYGRDIEALCECAEKDSWSFVPGTKTYWAQLRFAVKSEMVEHLDDLLLRRSRIGLFQEHGGAEFEQEIRSICQEELAWSTEKWNAEWQRYQEIWQQYYSVPK